MLSPLLLLSLVAVSLASPLGRGLGDFQVKHAWDAVPAGWEYHSPAPADHVLHMHFALKQGKFDELLRHLAEVSEPQHERYGQHLSKEEVDALVAPHPDTLSTVEGWLAAHGLDPENAIHRSSSGDSITLKVSVSQAEKLLDSKYNVYRAKDDSEYVVRTMGYSLPEALHDHINLVSPTTYFGGLQRMKTTSFVEPDAPTVESADESDFAIPPASCNTVITPECLRVLYNTAGYTPSAKRTSLGVVGYLEEYASNADLRTFLSRFRSDLAGTTFSTVRVNGGGNNQSDPGVEANLDIQYTVGLSGPIPNTYYSTGGRPPFVPDSTTPTNTNEPYLDWLNFILGQKTIPHVFTTSYGEPEQTIPKDYAITVCNRFAELGARGSSIFFSSGDFGVGGGDCLTNDGTNVRRFQPTFPAGCPFVTAVGGTVGTNPETTVGFTGGGFSNLFPRPKYQDAAVTGYLGAIGNSNAGLFNNTGRGYPDVAAQGRGFQVVVAGRVISVGGTSASSPTIAAIFALLNDYRISRGGGPLGFLNPLIYSTARTGFNDITTGNNPGCGTNGFAARAGWDPATGFGTPDFVKLQALV
ncbi:subtilisin-like protein [Pterulicium gracile]|uniref:tripeptidyl-peptidase II n=1 Tax=Pterulicium gracile TaxID=1884261 RepID=A0A5C3QJD3_9AGAR|nr:subtilisin-like protein [Pterula gracilis]